MKLELLENKVLLAGPVCPPLPGSSGISSCPPVNDSFIANFSSSDICNSENPLFQTVCCPYLLAAGTYADLPEECVFTGTALQAQTILQNNLGQSLCQIVINAQNSESSLMATIEAAEENLKATLCAQIHYPFIKTQLNCPA